MPTLGVLLVATLAASPPPLIAPTDGAALHMPIPSFAWRQVFQPTPKAMPSYAIQIATDPAFTKIADRDTLPAVVTHYVPDKPLAPGTYYWRVAGLDAGGASGPWSPARTFTVRTPRTFRVAGGSTFEQIRDVLAKASAAAPAGVVFERATYRLDLDEPRAFIELAGVEDVTIDGNGSTIVFNRPAPVAVLTKCRRVLLRGFTFDYDPPVYTAGRIGAVDANAGTMDLDILPGHSLPDAHPRYDEDRKGMIVTEADGFAIKRDIDLVVAHAGFEQLDGRRYRFRLANVRQARLLAPGDIYVLDPRWREAGSFRVFGGEEVVLYDLTLYGGANECLGSFYADRHSILHVRLKRKDGRALSVNNGGNNHHNARHGPWIEGCLFENTGDDVCHVNGYVMSIAAQPAADRIQVHIPTPYDQFCREAALDFRVGDRLHFYQRGSGRLIGQRHVKAVQRKGELLDVTLDADIEGITPGRIRPAKGPAYAATENNSVTGLFNASRACNQFVFRNNVARNSRRVGVLAKGDGGLIENNLFENLGGGGVEFWNAPFEGLAAENYVVRNNRMVNCLRLRRKHAAIWCVAFRPGGSRIHRNLLIEGNEIVGARWPAVDVGDAENVVFRNNRIVRPGADGVLPSQLVQFRNVGGLLQEGTKVVGPQSR